MLVGCTSSEEKACRRASELWAGQGPTEAETIMGRTYEQCMTRIDRLKPGRRDCIALCYQQATTLSAIYECEQQKCQLTAVEVR